MADAIPMKPPAEGITQCGGEIPSIRPRKSSPRKIKSRRIPVRMAQLGSDAVAELTALIDTMQILIDRAPKDDGLLACHGMLMRADDLCCGLAIALAPDATLENIASVESALLGYTLKRERRLQAKRS